MLVNKSKINYKYVLVMVSNKIIRSNKSGQHKTVKLVPRLGTRISFIHK